MNKKIFYFVLLIMSVTFFSACSDDDDPTPSISEEVTGTYKGDLNVKIPQVEAEQTTLQKIILSKSGEGQVKLELNDFAFSLDGNTNIQLGKIEVDNVPISKNGETYNLAETSIEGYKLANGTITANIKVSGTIVGKKADLKIDVTEATLVGDVFVTFNGDRMDADNEKTEALIKSMTIDSKIVTAQPVITDNSIVFYISESASAEDLKALKPVFEISEGATIDPASGSTVDFSANNVTFTVTAEDGIHKTTYTATWLNTQIYDFEEWIVENPKAGEKLWVYAPVGGWSSSNIGAGALMAMTNTDTGKPFADKYVVTQSSQKEAHSGSSAARIETIYTYGKAYGSGFFRIVIPTVTSGSLFLGTFQTDLFNTLKSTKFGIPYKKEPLKLKGYYKYTPGPIFYRSKDASTADTATPENGTIDECSINAILYEISSEKDEYLTGLDAYTSNKLVATAILKDGTAKTEYTPFDIDFEYVNGKTYDANKQYRISIICSSSKYGDTFSGAPGSVLYVDDIEIISK